MYPLKVLLVGCTPGARSDLQHELTDLAATVDAEFPDLASALARLSAPFPEPRLFVVQPRSQDEVKQLERLNDTFAGQPVLALVDPADDPSLLHGAMRAGAAQVVRLPLDAHDFQKAARRIAVQFGCAVSGPRVIGICRADEGAGATTLAINLAGEIAQRFGVRCLLTEGAGLTVGVGKLAVLLGVEPKVTLNELLVSHDGLDPENIRKALVKVADNFHILPGPNRPVAPVDMTLQDLRTFIGHAHRMADVIVIDFPQRFDHLFFESLSHCNQVLLVAQQSVASVHALKQLRELLVEKHCPASQLVVLNRYHPDLKDFRAERVRDLLGLPEVFTVRNDWVGVMAAQNNGRLLRQEAPNSPTLADIDALAARLLGRAGEAQRAGRSWLSWLRGR